MAEHIFETLAAEYRAAEHIAASGIEHLVPHRQSQAPAPQPVTVETTTPKETPVNITSIANDIKTAVGNADDWVKQVTDTHLPAILAAAQKYENSPIVQALETALLPPEVEKSIAATITELAKTFPAPAAAPEQPATAVPAGQ
jgi:hypothetical protein